MRIAPVTNWVYMAAFAVATKRALIPLMPLKETSKYVTQVTKTL
jgi:type IV secretory pathway component VirB8